MLPSLVVAFRRQCQVFCLPTYAKLVDQVSSAHACAPVPRFPVPVPPPCGLLWRLPRYDQREEYGHDWPSCFLQLHVCRRWLHSSEEPWPQCAGSASANFVQALPEFNPRVHLPFIDIQLGSSVAMSATKVVRQPSMFYECPLSASCSAGLSPTTLVANVACGITPCLIRSQTRKILLSALMISFAFFFVSPCVALVLVSLPDLSSPKGLFLQGPLRLPFHVLSTS